MARLRHVTHQPLTPRRDGQPPRFVVSCLDCGFSRDAHGQDAGDAVLAVAPSHDRTHRLTAQPTDYTTGYGEQGTDPHPLYTK